MRNFQERRQFEIQVQNRAKEIDKTMFIQLDELHRSITNIQTCAATSLQVMEMMKQGTFTFSFIAYL